MAISGEISLARELRTRRLRLSPYRAGDAGALHALFSEPDVMRYLFDDQAPSRQWVEQELERDREVWSRYGVGQYLILRGEDGSRERPLGFAGFRPFFEPPELQLLYGLHPEAWGHGYATEAAGELLRAVFEELGFERVVATTDPPNRASSRVLQRLDMRFLEQYPRAGKVVACYRLTRSEWQEQRSSR